MRLLLPVLIIAATVGTATVAMSQGGGAGKATVTLRNSTGDKVAKVTMLQRDDFVEVTARATGFAPGYHGFHVHESGVCAAPSSDDGETGAFLSAGGHFLRGNQIHGEHAGDMPPLFVRSDGTAFAKFQVDTFEVSQLASGDGSAVMIHEDPDNSANVPNRYKSKGGRGPDLETRETGDSGDRAACGVIAPS